MAGKSKSAKKKDPNRIEAVSRPDEDEDNVIARTVMCPSVQAAVSIKEYDKAFGDLGLAGLIDSLSDQITLSNSGDLKRAEAMLTAQAHTLDAIFNNLAQRAIRAEYMNNLERYLKFALRAQSQCRATWETLATIKNPPVVGYARQANIAHGPQQVNNQTAGQENTPRAGENQNLQNKLLENNDGERLDFGTTNSTSGDDSSMATVGKINRTKN